MEATRRPLEAAAPAAPAARLATVDLAAPAPGRPSRSMFAATLTRNPETPAFLEQGFTRPDEPCAPPVCSEVEVVLPASPPGGTRTLYARLAWENPAHYVHLWGIAPDGAIVGEAAVAESFEKETGNERTIPVAEFTVPDPLPGVWRVQARAVFGHEIAVTGLVALSAGGPVQYPRADVRTLADRHLTQELTLNIVFAGRTWTSDEVAAFRDNLPLEYRLAVHGKQVEDCGSGLDSNGIVAIRAWAVCDYTGTASEGAPGAKPYFEPVKFTFRHRFLQADERWTRDLFGAMEAATTRAEPFGNRAQTEYLANYDATQGKQTRGDRPVADPTRGDKIDAVTVEDWVMEHRLDARYARSFRDVDTGEVVSARFVNPDPGAYFDPFYTAKGAKDLETMPQGPATSLTFFVLDTFSDRALVDEYFRPDAYHFFDVSRVMLDPDTGRERGPDFARVWGGRYRFFLHDLGAGPNSYEVASSFTGSVAGSAAYPDGDPPIWDYDNDPRWRGLLAERTARDATTMLLYRFVAPFAFRPVPADVYLLAANNWNDCYANPVCSPEALAKTDLTKVYDPDYVDRNLSAAIPAATFLTERSDARLRTYRDLGCASQRAVANPNPLLAGGDDVVLVPDANCVGKPSDRLQELLERAKARGDDLVGPGVSDFGVSAHVVRKYVEEHREELAPQPPGQFTITSVSTVFPGAAIWFLPIPGAAGGVAVTTPNGDSWGIFQSLNDVVKPAGATDCALSSPLAPGCGPVPPATPGTGFSYSLQHEASHFFGLHHPHDSLVVQKDADGKWQRYGYSYRHYGDFSQAPTTYAGAFAPYSVLDQDILQRGHAAERLRRMQDWLADAYLLDGAAGLPGPSAETLEKQQEAYRWRDVATGLFACGDYLHAERAMRNADLAAQGVFGPVVPARALRPGERVLFEVRGQPVHAPDGGPLGSCVRPAVSGGGPGSAGGAGSSGALPATGADAPLWPVAVLALLALPRTWARLRAGRGREHTQNVG